MVRRLPDTVAGPLRTVKLTGRFDPAVADRFNVNPKE